LKFNLRHVLIFLAILLLSVGFGFGFDAVATAVERKNHPRPVELQAEISQNAKEFGIPEAILWATVKTSSNFASNVVSEDGRIGLMQISPDCFSFVCTELLGEDVKDSGLLYDPSTNLRVGSAWLSYLYGRYGVWEHAFLAYVVGTETVDSWLSDPNNLSAQGQLKKIPNKTAASFAKKVEKAASYYSKLYYEV